MALTGRWSVGDGGKLRLDGMGQDMDTEAWVAGDELTLVIDQDRITFRRGGGP
jgi:hypothetical protein